MSGRRLRTAVAIVASSVPIAAATWLVAVVLIYRRLSRVRPACAGHFARVTPANLAYDDTDLAAPDSGIVAVTSAELAGYAMPDYREVSFPARGDRAVTIRGWWIPARDPDSARDPDAAGDPDGAGDPLAAADPDAADPTAAAVILVHGRDSCRRDWNVLVPAGMLRRAGFAVLLIDLRNQGSSDVTDGRYAGGLVEYRDVLGAWDWLVHARGILADRVGLFGVSLGAASVLLAAASEPAVVATWSDSCHADARTRVREELAQRGYPSFLAAAGSPVGRLAGGVDLYARSPLSELPRLAGRSLFIVHGADDALTGVDHATDLDAAGRRAGVAVETWIVPNAGHTRALLVAREMYERKLVDFFTRTLAGAGRRADVSA